MNIKTCVTDKKDKKIKTLIQNLENILRAQKNKRLKLSILSLLVSNKHISVQRGW
jgi:hypothetical protein